MTKQEAFKEINETQDYYVNELLNKINSTSEDYMKVINFQSPTGTGKTKMMAKLMNLMPDVFFIVTTLSKGQLDRQIEANLKADCKYNNFAVYGCQKYTVNSKLQANDILSLIPTNKQFIWLRDEGHINTNRWEDLLKDKAFKMINITATPDNADIKCNFTNTMMLRTVHQSTGTPKDAIKKLLEVKKQHSNVKNYNPCAIFRCIDDRALLNKIIKACEDAKLRYINITDDDYDMSDLCKDDNKYDVIINKFKIVEGIDIRRAHILYMDNQPSNAKTTIQVIGRCRRNALLYSNEVDIFAPENKTLLKNTRQCFVYYNVEDMKIDEDENGELASAFCDTISVEQLKPNSIITADNGVLPNGLTIIELNGASGIFRVLQDPTTGFNIIKPEGDFYKDAKVDYANTIDFRKKRDLKDDSPYQPIPCSEILNNWKKVQVTKFNYVTGRPESTGEYYYTNLTEKTTSHIVTKIQLEKALDKLMTIKFTTEPIKNYIKKMYNGQYRIHGVQDQYCICSFVDLYISNRHIDVQLRALAEDTVSKATDLTVRLLANDSYRKAVYDTYEDAEKAVKQYINKIKKANFTYYITDQKNRWFGSKVSYEATSTMQWSNAIEYNKTEVTDLAEAYLRPYWFGSKSKELKVTPEQLANNSNYFEYTKTINDRESAIIGVDHMKHVKDKDTKVESWVEDRAVTSKVKRASKFNTFIGLQYKQQIEQAKQETFTGKNKFNFDNRCNKCLGYCVEYYSKYLVYGKRYLGNWIKEARKEAGIKDTTFVNDNLIIRACMLKYRELMINAYGSAMAKVITTIGAQQLIRESYAEFVKTVIELGTKTADFVKQELNITRQLQDDDKLYDPNLSIRHITGLADYINKDTIIDIKTTNYIDISHIKQVLAYHYLSTKRSDLDIKTVIVYDAVSGRSVKISL